MQTATITSNVASPSTTPSICESVTQRAERGLKISLKFPFTPVLPPDQNSASSPPSNNNKSIYRLISYKKGHMLEACNQYKKDKEKGDLNQEL